MSHHDLQRTIIDNAHSQYQSYDSSRTPERGDQSLKETIISATQIRKITDMAFADRNNTPRMQLFKERKDLYEVSKAHVKQWGNTIAGSIQKRLAAADLKEKSAEAERVRIDEEWAVVKAYEKAETVKRARELQKFEEPKYRELNSKLVLSNVLKERDLQIEYKMKRKLEDKIYEKEEILRMRVEHLKNLEKDLEKQNDIIKRQQEFEKGLAVDVLKRKAEKSKDFKDKTSGVQELAKLQQEIHNEKEQATKKKYLATKEFMATLANQIDEKKRNNEHKEFLAAELDAQNARFNAMKNSYYQKRKEFYDKKTETKMTAHISPLNLKSANEKENARSNFLAALANAPFKRPVHNPACISPETFKKELEDYRAVRNATKDALKKSELDEMIKEKEINAVNLEKWKREEKLIVEKRKQNLLDIKDYNLIAEKKNISKKNNLEQENLRLENSILENRKKADLEFDEYANNILSEWKNQDKNINPIVKVLSHEKGYTLRKPSILNKKQDHFSRLGFTGRELPDLVLPKIEGAIE